MGRHRASPDRTEVVDFELADLATQAEEVPRREADDQLRRLLYRTWYSYVKRSF